MTLILTLGNSEQFIQVSDRRLSWNGQLVEDESNKAGLLTCIDARLAFGFTGLARFAGFVTRDWLLDAIYESGPPDYSSDKILQRLKARASDTFKNNGFLRKAPQKDKRISILFSGYLYHHDPPLLVYSIITNFQDCEAGIDDAESWEEFKIYFFTEKVNPRQNNPTIVQRIGNWRAMNQTDGLILRNLLEAKKPTGAIIGKVIELIREMADRPTAQGTIGKQLSTICIYPDPKIKVVTNYYSNVNKYEIYMPDSVELLSDTHRLCIKQFMIEDVAKMGNPMAVPKVGRNHPCPCGSGKKYKYCHGKG